MSERNTEFNSDTEPISKLQMFKKPLIIFWAVFSICVLAAVLFFAGVSNGTFGFMPSFEELENPKNSLATEVYTVDGNLIGKFYFENRSFVEYHELSHFLVDALIATEDVRFNDHSGIDVRGLGRVAKGLVTGNKSAGGGSTISQQLAKMLFPRESFEKKMEIVFRKFREWVIAVKLERSYTKEEIMTMYFNKFDFLNLAVGIKSAANVYFNTTPDSLKIEQAAMLVGMAKNPSYFNPLRRPELTLNRRNVVLSQMVRYDYLSKMEFDSLKNLPLGIDFQKVDHKRGMAPYFREYLRTSLTANEPLRDRYPSYADQQFVKDSIEWETNPFYGWCNKNVKADGTPYNIYKDGLKIFTTLDSRMQRYAEEAVVEHLGLNLQKAFNREKENHKYPPFSDDLAKEDVEQNIETSMRRSERYRVLKKNGMSMDSIRLVFKNPTKMKIFTWKGERDTILSPNDSMLYMKGFLRAGFMSMEPQTGEVRAYVGGPNYEHFMYDMVNVGKRQVGSTIKPFLYTLAMQEGLGPCDKVPNIPQTFILPDGTPWTSKNSTDARSGEMVTLKWGLANSVNYISAWVLKQTTPESVVKMAHEMGVISEIDPVPSIFLGTSEITVYEMVGAYSTFVNKGVYIKPSFITKIEDHKGNVLAQSVPRKHEVMDERTAYLMTNLLQGVVQRGTGRRLRFTYGLNNPIGGKTGTTQNHSDGWFMGITPELVSGVWVGAEDRSVHFEGISLGQGANMALPIWALYMQKVYADKSLGLTQGDFEKPRGVSINLDCDDESNESNNKELIESENEDFF
ncbi:transglycosylase domain-containing protein [Labilibaculum sp. K2S]|uniref:penicillin-binding protein 1A n=1 Tax=Labilibaculum sp. K2S TaxID=3056386 RepID=UPI0025A49FE3|nr:transglycosylase domain-containing protein [Labilibaculum sp. K2S]MDM8161210.1 transglycosylase domain-containing protein [Labilibaculum sp. K2S]